MLKRRWCSLLFLLLASLCLAGFFSPAESMAFSFGSPDTLAIINGTTYTTQDYLDWWREWREPGMTAAADPDDFIDWLLMAEEARQMRLFEKPRYLHKINIFLKSRSLMLLKQEEVDGRIVPPGNDRLRQEYDQRYQPIISLTLASLPDATAAAKVKELGTTDMTISEAITAAGFSGVPIRKQSHVRPLAVDESFKVLFADSGNRQQLFLLPQAAGCLLARVENITAGSDDDFARLKETIRTQLIKDQQQQLNTDLLARLRHKYQPVIDQEKLAALEPGSGQPADVVIKIGNLTITGDQVAALLTKEQRMRQGRTGTNTVNLESLKQQVVNNILAQTLVSLEALEHHYEEHPPFKQTFAFYCRHRLIKELEQEVIHPRATVAEVMVADAYARNRHQYLQPPLVEVAWVQTANPSLCELLDRQLGSGKDFFTVMTPYFPEATRSRTIPETKLPAEIRELVAGLQSGQTATHSTAGQEKIYVKLLQRHAPEPLPLVEVAEEIRTRLQEERFKSEKKHLAEQLRQRSTITVKEKTWKKLRKQLMEEHVD
ncbi:MAG: peptidyl-prolyl cis-trans isomerase [Deltaproteobacteria bacterium]|nr:peptidyl-prolyl cis-trans isomerase [Candidatus Anaeroferrophillus wilburensis]MBN2887835.1 peptidyl-prolyl cis-trans isomerase [Deltaproteobacteria bacterium]